MQQSQWLPILNKESSQPLLPQMWLPQRNCHSSFSLLPSICYTTENPKEGLAKEENTIQSQRSQLRPKEPEGLAHLRKLYSDDQSLLFLIQLYRHPCTIMPLPLFPFSTYHQTPRYNNLTLRTCPTRSLVHLSHNFLFVPDPLSSSFFLTFPP